MKQAFKPRVARKHVGSYRPRVDGREKASGRAQYLDDVAMRIRFPGMLYAKVLRSPYAHARIKRMDVSRAEKLPGVKAVLTYDDPEVAALKPTMSAWTSPNTVSYDKMYWPKYRDRRVLSDHVCWVGDEAGAVVAAETEEIAAEALKLIEVEWEVLPFVLDPEEAMKPGAPVIHPEINPEGNVLPPEDLCGPDVFVERGDVEKALDESDVVIEVRSSWQNTDHGVLDTRGCLIEWKGEKLTCWTNYYQADQTRMHIAQMLDLPLHKVRVQAPYVGASMGRGNQGDQVFFIFTAILARRTGRPVKFKHTRWEDFHDSSNAIVYDFKVGAGKDGFIKAMHIKAVGDAGAYAEHTMAALKFIPHEAEECMFAPIADLKMEAYGVYTNKIPSSCMRGIGNNQLNLGFGLALDTLAEKLDMDPVEIAIKNLGSRWGSVPDKSVEGLLREGAERIGWENRHKADEGPFFDGTKKRGMGFSIHDSWHAAWQELPRGRVQVGIRLNPDGTVILEAPTIETGPGSNTCAVLACADALGFLGIEMKDITWVSTVDTETGLKDMVQTDSAVSYLHAEMMPEAAARLKDRILEMAAPELQVEPGELDIEDGRIFVQTAPDKGMTVKELLWNDTMVPVAVTVDRDLPDEITGIPYAAAFAEVEVDTATGKVEVLRLVVLNDCGTVMYATGVEAQEVGGQCIGVGLSLMEELIYDEATGIPLNFNWIDFKFPTMLDFPDVTPVPMEIWKGAGEYGACGLGEVVVTNTPRAVSNAIYNAVGVRVDEMPFTPEKILRAMAMCEENH